VAFHRARPNAHELRRVRDGSASGNEGREYVHLALRRRPRKYAAQVTVSHADLLAAAIYSSRRRLTHKTVTAIARWGSVRLTDDGRLPTPSTAVLTVRLLST